MIDSNLLIRHPRPTIQDPLDFSSSSSSSSSQAEEEEEEKHSNLKEQQDDHHQVEPEDHQERIDRLTQRILSIDRPRRSNGSIIEDPSKGKLPEFKFIRMIIIQSTRSSTTTTTTAHQNRSWFDWLGSDLQFERALENPSLDWIPNDLLQAQRWSIHPPTPPFDHHHQHHSRGGSDEEDYSSGRRSRSSTRPIDIHRPSARSIINPESNTGNPSSSSASPLSIIQFGIDELDRPLHKDTTRCSSTNHGLTTVRTDLEEAQGRWDVDDDGDSNLVSAGLGLTACHQFESQVDGLQDELAEINRFINQEDRDLRNLLP